MLQPPFPLTEVMESREMTPQPAGLQQWQEDLDTPMENDPTDDFGVRSKYDFRVAARQTQTTSFAWMDQDESGNYDPIQERKRAVVAPIMRRRRAPFECVENGEPKRTKILTWRKGRTIGQQLPVKLSIKSETGKACLRAFGSTLDNWPPSQSCASMSLKSPKLWGDNVDSDCTDLSSCGQGSYHFRKRDRRSLRKVLTFNGCDPPDLSTITLGYPEARGCKACLALCVRCPLLDEGSKYPCDECKEADIDCELVMEPKEKGSCEGCLRKRLPCSYREGSDPLWPCSNCFKHDFKCVAGPASGRTRTGPSLDQCLLGTHTRKPSTYKSRNSLQKRRPTAPEEPSGYQKSTIRSATQCCDQCSVAKKRWCSLNPDNTRAGCDYCRENGFSCIPESADHRQLRETRRAERTIVPEMDTMPVASMEINSPLRDKTIVTKLAHPVNYNYMKADTDGAIDCHWCEDLYYGLLGLGMTTIRVRDLGDAQGYQEQGDGFTAAGFLPSRMCHGCTTERMGILVCNGHEIKAIPGIDPDSSDFKSYVDWLEPSKASSAPFLWCSICPAPAVYKCGAMDNSIVESDDATDGHGCGLCLCEQCAVMLVGEHDGKVEDLIDKLQQDMEKTDGIFELRADADFLHPKGELARRWPYLTVD